MSAWMVIARREFVERVRTKWFLIATILGPIGMVAAIVLPALLGRGAADRVRVRVVDGSGQVAAPLVAAFTAAGWQAEEVPATTPEAELRAQIADDRIDGYLTLPADVLARGEAVYRGDNASSPEVGLRLQLIVSRVVQGVRGAQAGLTAPQIAAVLMPVVVRAEHTTGTQEASSGTAAMLVGYAVMLILYMAIVLYGVNVMRSVVQEKTSRVVELMVAVTRPRALMAGKIVGVGAVGLVQIGVWLGMAVLTLRFRTELLGALGVDGGGGFAVPPLAAPEITIVLAYFVFGYFFYAAVFAALGAMVSSEQEAQQAATPVSLLLVVPLVCVNMITADPRGGAAELLTLVPLSSPLLMPMRYLLGGAGPGQLALSLGLLVAATLLVTALSARIYRIGILMYGKRPSLRELWRWLRHA
ncbi:MAG: ABC transporter permease [Kofleriaceae bacterium]